MAPEILAKHDKDIAKQENDRPVSVTERHREDPHKMPANGTQQCK